MEEFALLSTANLGFVNFYVYRNAFRSSAMTELSKIAVASWSKVRGSVYRELT